MNELLGAHICPMCKGRMYKYVDPEGRWWLKCIRCNAQIPAGRRNR